MNSFTWQMTNHTINARMALPEPSTREDAQAIAAMFPKSLRVKGTTLSTFDHDLRDRTGEYRNFTVGFVAIDVKLTATEVTGSENETGIKRFRSFLKNCEKLGFEVEYKRTFGNSLTEQEAREVIG